MSQINFKDETLDASDGVTKLLLAAEYWKEKASALRSRIAEMEQQKPVGKFVQHPSNGLWEQDGYGDNPEASPLYALPGAQAQPAPIVPEVTDAMIEAIESRAEQSYRRHHGGARGQQIVPADALSWHIIHATRKVLSEAPEAKPCP